MVSEVFSTYLHPWLDTAIEHLDCRF